MLLIFILCFLGGYNIHRAIQEVAARRRGAPKRLSWETIWGLLGMGVVERHCSYNDSTNVPEHTKTFAQHAHWRSARVWKRRDARVCIKRSSNIRWFTQRKCSYATRESHGNASIMDPPEIFENVWKYLELFGNLFGESSFGKLWKTLEIFGILWKSLEIVGNLWKSLENMVWKSLEIFGNHGLEIFVNLWKKHRAALSANVVRGPPGHCAGLAGATRKQASNSVMRVLCFHADFPALNNPLLYNPHIV